MSTFPRRDFLLIIGIAIIVRLMLLASNSVSFHSDEAIVALMARHINQGARPVFFYGQAYMGSLDAWLVSFGFRLFGESVLSIRLVQSLLYMLVVATGYLVAWNLSHRRIVAAVAGLLLAVPAVNTALYTTATLGGYNETLLLGNLILLLGYAVTHEHPRSLWRWGLLGLAGGLAWWTNGLIVMTIIPIGLMALWVWLRQSPPLRDVVPGLALALVCFILGSAPWWVFDFTHDHAALSTYITNRQSGEFEGIGIPYVPPSQRALGLLVVGIPTLIGMKFPWESAFFLLPVGIVALLIYSVAVWRLARGQSLLRPHARLLILLMLAVFVLIFVLSTFGADPTGRYFLPLILPLGIAVGVLVQSLRDQLAGRPTAQVIPFALVALLVAYHGLGQIVAARSQTGFTTQFDLISHIANDDDAALIDFLQENQLYNGHTNYWVAFRLAFLSGETLQYSASLPYKQNLSYNAADNRYQPYVDATKAAGRMAYITTNLPELDQRLEAAFDQQGITYAQTRIGAYHIYYDFAPTLPVIEPESLSS